MTESWGAALYGDPCRECGFGWSLAPVEALELVAGIPSRYAGLLAGYDGTQRHPALGWTAGGYVCHVTDNLRIWAERLVGAARGGVHHVAGYDQDLLAQARRYEAVPVAGALWSLGQAATGWTEALAVGLADQVSLQHAERGRQSAEDVARNNAHDAFHHAWDIQRCLQAVTPP